MIEKRKIVECWSQEYLTWACAWFWLCMWRGKLIQIDLQKASICVASTNDWQVLSPWATVIQVRCMGLSFSPPGTRLLLILNMWKFRMHPFVTRIDHSRSVDAVMVLLLRIYFRTMLFIVRVTHRWACPSCLSLHSEWRNHVTALATLFECRRTVVEKGNDRPVSWWDKVGIIINFSPC